MKTLIAILATGIIISSCSNTQVISSWKSEQAPAQAYKKVLVMGIFNQKNRALRGLIENTMVGQLENLGYHAVSALDVFGPKAFQKMSEDSIASELVNSGYDAVITTSLLDKSKEEHYTPGNVQYHPIGIYYNRFGRYYATIYDRIYQPGYYTSTTNFFLETNLCNLNSKELIYSVQGKTFSPSSSTELSRGYVKEIIKDMKLKGVLTKQ